MRTALYRHWDAEDNLLYVGISLSAVQRLGQHKSSSHWYNEIASVTIEWFDSREDALAAERDAIQIERPLHNKVHNAANDNHPEPEIMFGMGVYLVRHIEDKSFHGVFWAHTKADLWDTFDQFGDPYGFEFARLDSCGAICHPDSGVLVPQILDLTEEELEVFEGVSLGEFEPDEMLSDALYQQSKLTWEPFCAADEGYGMIARIFERHSAA